jgi:hypothetical protein
MGSEMDTGWAGLGSETDTGAGMNSDVRTGWCGNGFGNGYRLGREWVRKWIPVGAEMSTGCKLLDIGRVSGGCWSVAC